MTKYKPDDEEYQKACERAAEAWANAGSGLVNTIRYCAFIEGVRWANANPSPRVMRLLPFARHVSSCPRADNKFQDMAEEALADFESEEGK